MSELYQLPDGWEWKKLDSLTEVNIGKTPPRKIKEYFTGNNIWLSIRDLKGDYVNSSNEYITDEAIKKTNIKIIQEGTLLMSFKLTLGRTAFAKKDLYTNEAIASLPIKNDNILNKYFLRYCLGFIDLEVEVDNAVKGKTLNKQKIKNLNIPLPPLEEQKRIVSKLDNIFTRLDKAINLHQKNIDEANAFMGSVLNDIFAQADEKYWELKKFSDIFKIISSKKYQINKSDYLENGKIPVIDQGKHYIVGYTNNEDKIFNNNDNIIVFGDHTRNFKYIDFDFVVGADGIKLITLQDMNNYIKFFYYQFLSKDIKHLGYSRHFKLLKEMDIALPPLEEQKTIVEYLDQMSSKMDKIKEVQTIKMKELKALKSSILDSAFKGEI